MATAADSAQSRDAAEAQGTSLYAKAAVLAAVLYLASPDGDEPDLDADIAGPLLQAAAALALALVRSTPKRYGSDVPKGVGPSERDRVESLTRGLAQSAIDQAREHLATVAERVQRTKPDATKEEIAAAYRADTPWQRAAARTAATRLASETALSMVDDVDATAGVPHRVMWISRGDTRVRDMHRKLHGKIRKPGSAFKTWPSGQQLAFPGDPRAPLDAIINCRCSLLLVPESQAWKAMDVFKVSDEDFIAASAMRESMSQAELDLVEELSRGSLEV